MASATTLVLASDPEVADVGMSLLGRGNAVDAVAGAVFAAAGLHASVLFGPVQLLIGGAGAGFRAVDGRNRQPGLGNPRPRGFLPTDMVPAAARVGVPGLPAALLASVTTYGRLSVAAVIAPGRDLAQSRSPLRAKVLTRIAQRGPAALAEAGLSDDLVACAGRLAGGLLSVRDLDELRPEVAVAASAMAEGGREVVTVPWESRTAHDKIAALLTGDVRVVVAVDRNGLAAVACYEVAAASEGLHLEPFDIIAPFTATPVRRGQTRVKAGEVRPATAPIALGRTEGVLDLAVGVGAVADAEATLRTWLEGYEPTSALERQEPVPTGLLAVQRAGADWTSIGTSD